MCLGTQEDITDENTDCMKSCDGASNKIASLLDISAYQDSTFNLFSAMDTSSIFGIEFSGTMKDCRYNILLQMANERFSNWSFAGGMFGNLGVQLALYPLESVQSPVYKSVYQIINAVTNKNYIYMGVAIQLFISKLIGFSSPNSQFELNTIG